MENLLNTVMTWVTSTGIKIVIAIVILIVAFAVINRVLKKVGKSLEQKEKLDTTIVRTLTHAGSIGLKILVVICLIGYLGIDTSGLSALIASLGVCVGLAVNGTLSNLAGGIMILITRPFKIGDFITAQGYDGVVEEIKICNTKIITGDNKIVYLPNSSLSTGTIVNYSEKDLRRVDLDFSVAGNDPVAVRQLLLDICEKEALVLKDPAPFARITDFGAGNGMKLTVRAWCKGSDYWDCYFNLLDAAQKGFEEKKVIVPFNQLDVHIKND